MKILLTGASGLVGAALAPLAARAGHEVIGVVGRWSEAVPGTADLLARDLADPHAAADLVKSIQPDAIINAAAISEPAACEAEPALSRRVNVDFPTALATAAHATGALLLHISSEQVFNGERAPYRRDSRPRPLNLYGQQKFASEQQVTTANRRATVLRAPLLFGNSLGGRRSVHEKLFEQWAAGRVARLFTDEIRQVCSAGNFAAALIALVHRPDLHGIYQWAGREPVSRWAMGRRIIAHFGVAERWIEAVSRTDSAPEIVARRPRDLSLEVAPLDEELRVPREDLAAAVSALKRPRWAEKLSL
jgi:dTDP-4-dehydrorhamnose reductase